MNHGQRADTRHRGWLYGALLTATVASAAWGASATTEAAEKLFLRDSDAAMTTMMDAMQIEAIGNVDRDFATMMIPHHQGAIDMAVSELRYGSNEQLRRIAQEIVVDQTQEIAVMRTALGRSASASAARPTAMPVPMHCMRMIGCAS